MLPKSGNIAIGSPPDTPVPHSSEPVCIRTVPQYARACDTIGYALRRPDSGAQASAAAALVPLLDGNANDVAALIGTDQPRVSDIGRGKVERFSLETLIRRLVRRRCRVELHISHERPNYGGR
jgi:hypothetical protein